MEINTEMIDDKPNAAYRVIGIFHAELCAGCCGSGLALKIWLQALSFTKNFAVCFFVYLMFP